MENLRKLKELYNTGKIVLNNKVLEKVSLYLDSDKVLDAAGVHPDNIPIKEKERLDKRNKRIYIT